MGRRSFPFRGNANVSSLFSLGSGSSGSTIQGLDLYDYSGDAVQIYNSTATANGFTQGNFIQNNWIGFFRDPTTGQVSLNCKLGGNFNDTSGIYVQSNDNVIRNNVIDGNFNGISVVGQPAVEAHLAPSVNNSITSNFIGNDPSGTTAAGYGNQGNGIFLAESESTQIAGNVISGNALNGIEMALADLAGDVFPDNNVISGNKIGTDVSGSYAIPNGTGITISGVIPISTIAANNDIDGNLISGNLNAGITLGVAGYGPGNSNTIQGNIIGLNASQTAVISPGSYGIFFTDGSTGNNVHTNVIAGAKLAGVVSGHEYVGQLPPRKLDRRIRQRSELPQWLLRRRAAIGILVQFRSEQRLWTQRSRLRLRRTKYELEFHRLHAADHAIELSGPNPDHCRLLCSDGTTVGVEQSLWLLRCATKLRVFCWDRADGDYQHLPAELG